MNKAVTAANEPYLTIGQLAARTAVRVGTVRYYERCGLLPRAPRLASGYRHFGANAVERLRFIRAAQALGFSLAEIPRAAVAARTAGRELRRRARACQRQDRQDRRADHRTAAHSRRARHACYALHRLGADERLSDSRCAPS